jgi:predicted TIM-barrel fold metal-dependent hydrolase
MELSENAGYTGFHPDLRLNDTRIEWLWEEMEKRRLVIVLDLGPIGGKAYQTKAVKKILDSHPDLKMVITHLSYPPLKKQGDKRLNQLWQEQVLLARYPGVWLDLASLPAHAGSAPGEDYPYPGACKYIRKAIKLVGADKLLWGTDVPGLLTVATYSQLLTYITNHCNFISPSARAKILGGNALRAYGE